MGNFVTGNTPLPAAKRDANPPVTPEIESDAADFNNLWAAAGDVRTAVLRPDASSVLSIGSTTPRTLADRFRDVINVKDYGLACDGVTNDYPALAAMLALLGSTPATLIVPGPCLIGTSITIPATLPVRFEGAGAFTGAGTVTFTRWTPGGSQVGASSLFTAGARQSKLWTLQDVTATAFMGIGTVTSVHFGAGGSVAVAGADRNWLQFTLPATANAGSGHWWGGTSNGWSRGLNVPKIATRCRINQLTTSTAGMDFCSSAGGALGGSSSYVPTLGGSNADASVFTSIRRDSRVGPNWFAGSGNGTTATWIDLGLPVTTTDDFLLLIEYLTATSFRATVTNCTSGASGSITSGATMPATTTVLGPNISAGNYANTANNGPYFEYFYMEHN